MQAFPPSCFLRLPKMRSLRSCGSAPVITGLSFHTVVPLTTPEWYFCYSLLSFVLAYLIAELRCFAIALFTFFCCCFFLFFFFCFFFFFFFFRVCSIFWVSLYLLLVLSYLRLKHIVLKENDIIARDQAFYVASR